MELKALFWKALYHWLLPIGKQRALLPPFYPSLNYPWIPRAQGFQQGHQKALYTLKMQALGEELERGVWMGGNISLMALKYTYGYQTANTPCGCQQCLNALLYRNRAFIP